MNIKNAFITTNGVIIFNKIKLGNNSAAFFMKSNTNKKNTFEIGASNIDSDGYLFYDLENKWIETIYLNDNDTKEIKKIPENKKLTQLFLFEWINKLRNFYNIDFIKIDDINVFKINSIKDVPYAKKIYKKYSSIFC
jgi:hypothetical protein